MNEPMVCDRCGESEADCTCPEPRYRNERCPHGFTTICHLCLSERGGRIVEGVDGRPRYLREEFRWMLDKLTGWRNLSRGRERRAYEFAIALVKAAAEGANDADRTRIAAKYTEGL